MNLVSSNFSIIVPAYREAKNIKDLAKKIAEVDFGQRKFEVLIIDDNSRDGTEEIVTKLSAAYPWLKLIVRKQKKDLSQSIIKGLESAQYPLLVTMDADLSHPPAEIPNMLALLEKSQIDMVIGSRYVRNGSVDKDWPFIRKITSKTAAFIAKAVLLKNVKDPLSGFLALRKTTFLTSAPLKPLGWKIGLELMVKCPCKNIREIPIYFAERKQGASKLNFKISLYYLLHVLRLLKYKLFKIC